MAASEAYDLDKIGMLIRAAFPELSDESDVELVACVVSDMLLACDDGGEFIEVEELAACVSPCLHLIPQDLHERCSGMLSAIAKGARTSPKHKPYPSASRGVEVAPGSASGASTKTRAGSEARSDALGTRGPAGSASMFDTSAIDDLRGGASHRGFEATARAPATSGTFAASAAAASAAAASAGAGGFGGFGGSPDEDEGAFAVADPVVNLGRSHSVGSFRLPELQRAIQVAQGHCDHGVIQMKRRDTHFVVSVPTKVVVPGSKKAVQVTVQVTVKPSDPATGKPGEASHAPAWRLAPATRSFDIFVSTLTALSAMELRTLKPKHRARLEAAEQVCKRTRPAFLSVAQHCVAGSNRTDWLWMLATRCDAALANAIKQIAEEAGDRGSTGAGRAPAEAAAAAAAAASGPSSRAVAPGIASHFSPFAAAELQQDGLKRLGTAGFAIGGSHFMHGGHSSVTYAELLRNATASSPYLTELVRSSTWVMARTPDRLLGSTAATGPLLPQPLVYMRRHNLPLRPLFTSEHKIISTPALKSLMQSYGIHTNDEECLEVISVLSSLFYTRYEHEWSGFHALALSGSKPAWVEVPLTPSSSGPCQASYHSVVPIGNSKAIVIAPHLHMVTLRRDRSTLAGWNATWTKLGKVAGYTPTAGSAAVRVPGRACILLFGNKSTGSFVRELTWKHGTPTMTDVVVSRGGKRATPRYGCSVAVCGRFIVVFGGHKLGSTLRSNELNIMDAETRAWMPIIPGPRSAGVTPRSEAAIGSMLTERGLAFCLYGGISGEKRSSEMLIQGDMDTCLLATVDGIMVEGATGIAFARAEPGAKHVVRAIATTWERGRILTTPMERTVMDKSRRIQERWFPISSAAFSSAGGRLVLSAGLTRHALTSPIAVSARSAAKVFSGSMNGTAPSQRTLAFKLGATTVTIAASTFSADIARMIKFTQADGEAAHLGAEDSQSSTEPELWLRSSEGDLVGVHAPVFFAAAPSLREDLLAVCNRRSCTVTFRMQQDDLGVRYTEMDVAPLFDDDSQIAVPELSGDYAASASASVSSSAAVAASGAGADADPGSSTARESGGGVQVTLVDWTTATGGALQVDVEASTTAVRRLVHFLYTRAGSVTRADAEDVLAACEGVDLAPLEADEEATESGWRWVGKTDIKSAKTTVAWADTKEGSRVCVDLRLFRAAQGALALKRNCLLDAKGASGSGDRTLRRSLGSLLSGLSHAVLLDIIVRCALETAGVAAGTAVGDHDHASSAAGTEPSKGSHAATGTGTGTGIGIGSSAPGAGSAVGDADEEGDDDAHEAAEEFEMELRHEAAMRLRLPRWDAFWTLGADTAVRVGHRVLVPAHRAILVARSGFFQGALTGAMAEAQDGVIGIGLEGLPAAAGLSLLSYLYTDSAPSDIDPDLAVPLIRLALLHMLPRLSSRCERAIVEGFDFGDPDSLVGLWLLSDSLGSGVASLHKLVLLGLRSLPESAIASACRSLAVDDVVISEIKEQLAVPAESE